jgi:multidrug efflux pump subunit AcrA (membrane-fusion protein)
MLTSFATVALLGVLALPPKQATTTGSSYDVIVEFVSVKPKGNILPKAGQKIFVVARIDVQQFRTVEKVYAPSTNLRPFPGQDWTLRTIVPARKPGMRAPTFSFTLIKRALIGNSTSTLLTSPEFSFDLSSTSVTQGARGPVGQNGQTIVFARDWEVRFRLTWKRSNR